MKKLFLAAALLLPLLSARPAAAQVPTEKSLLWEVSGKGLSKPSYLYGTIHAICPNQLKVSASLNNRFKQTQQLYLELDLDNPEILVQSVQRAQMPKGKTLRQLMSTQDYKKLDQMLKSKAGISADRINTLKPLLVGGLLSDALLGCKATSWEAQLMQMAQRNQVEVLGLETVQEQMGALDQISLNQQAKDLVQLVNQFSQSQKDIRQLSQIYQQQDIAKLYNLTTSPSNGGKTFDTAILRDRNRRWIPRIANIAKSQPTLFAFGAAHLGGSEGVIALLRRSGYTVKPIYK